MKRILRRRPSPALVISLIALFAAMGGTAYAALTITGANVKTNSLNGSDIRDIKGGDIRNYSISGKDIGKDALGRIPIKEERLDSSKIGKVPLATSAEQFGGLTPKPFAAFTLDTAGTRELLRAGPLTLTARCRADGGDQVAEVVVQTNTNGAAADGATPDANIETTETVPLITASATLGTPSFATRPDAFVIGPPSTTVIAQQFYVGASGPGAANKCRFGGVLYTG